MKENEKMAQFAAKYYKASDELYPSTATAMGIHDYDGELEDLSPEGIEKSRKIHEKFEGQLGDIDFDVLSKDEKIMFHIVNSNIKASMRHFERTREYEKDPALYADLAIQSVFILLMREFAPLEDRLRSAASRLSKVPGLYAAAKKNLKNPPRVYTEIALDTLEGAGSLLNDLIPRMAKKTPSIKNEINKALEKANKATEEYKEFLKNEILPRSKGDFAIGKEIFDEMLRENDFLDYTSDDLWEIGGREVKKCEEELTNFCRKNLDPNKTWRENFSDVKSHHPAADKILDTYNKYLENARQFVIAHDLVTIPENQVIIGMETPEFNRSMTPLAAYMPPAPYEEDQRGFLWVTPIDLNQSAQHQEKQLRDNCFGKIQYVSLHECYPGHHLQLVYTSGVKNPIFKRIFSNIFIEGWAFYAEQLMKDYGYMDVEGVMCQLEAAYWRAIRILLDVGLHTGRFTYESAMKFMEEKTDWSPFIAKGEIQRYTRTPAQALSYYTGKLEIFRIKEEYKKMKGDEFNLKQFHEDLLHCGSLPPKLIEWKLGMKEIEKPGVGAKV